MKIFSMLSYYNAAILFLLFLFPIQTIFILQERFLNGVKWEYGTLVLYGFEILIWLFTFMHIFLFRKLLIFKNKPLLLFLSFLLLQVIVLGFLHDSFLISFQYFRFILAASLFFYVVYKSNIAKESLFWVTALSTFCVALLALYQFFAQSFPIVPFLNLASHEPWVAGTSVVVGETFGRFARAYGTFPHPNILGGYLALFIIVSWYYRLSNKVKSQTENIFFILIQIMVIAGLIVSFSRSAWLALLVTFPWFVYKAYRMRQYDFIQFFVYILMTILILFLFLRPLILTRFTINSLHESQSIEERLTGYAEVHEVLKGNYLFGVGFGQYTRALANVFPDRQGWEYQPVHNVYLLFFAELGIVGIIVGFFVIGKLVNWFGKKFDDYDILFLFLVPLGIIGSFDHYIFSVYSGVMLVSWYLVFLVMFKKIEPLTRPVVQVQ